MAREVDFYNLDVIISVGYRVKSHRGTQFRIWATKNLREYIMPFAELRIIRQMPMYMEDWKQTLNKILISNEFKVLGTKGRASNASMKKIVKNELKNYLQKSSQGII